MGRHKKHMAVQEDFSFVNEIQQPINPLLKNLTEEVELKETIDGLNNYLPNNVAQELQFLQCDLPQPSVIDIYKTDSLQLFAAITTANNGPITEVKFDAQKNCIPPKKITRNTHGLYEHLDYVFNDEGFVNWRAMIPVRYLYVGDNIKENPVRREMFEKKYGKKPEKIDLTVDKVEDKDLLITLAGIRFLAALRGYESVRFEVLGSSNQGFSVVQCDVDWIPTFESPNSSKERHYSYQSFGGVACASLDNTYSFTKNYLPEMASNRAFCRAVRNFLNIDVVSDEEAFEKKEEPKPNNSGIASCAQPHELLKLKLSEKGTTFEVLKAQMSKVDKEWAESNWENLLDVPPLKIFDVLGRMKKKEEKKSNPIPE